MDLCQACDRIFSKCLIQSAGNDPSLNPILHHQSLMDFVRAVQDGCVVCRRGFRQLRPEQQHSLEERAGSITQTSSTPTGTKLFLGLEWINCEPPIPRLSLTLRLDLAYGYWDEFNANPSEVSELDYIDNMLSKSRMCFIPMSCKH
jgi:hypothetical protein